jgi:nitric oxide dioxygenase
MTPQQIALVQESFRAVVPIRTAAAALFYENLFARDRAIDAMFTGSDLSAQGAKLMTALAMVVQGLTRLDELLPTVQALGRRHVGYGVIDAQYETVGAALLDTLAAGLGPAFTPATRDAWRAAYGLLSGVMIEAARAHRRAAA